MSFPYPAPVRVALLALASMFPALAAEADALAISRNIQERHFPHFTLLDPIFDGPASNQIVNYTRCADSAIWTGHYLAAEAFRYAATRSPDALANARRAFAGIQSLVDVTGNNVLARCLIPDDSPYAQGIQNEEAHNGIYHSGAGNFWVGNTSRDQYTGVMFGLGVAYDLIDDQALKASIAGVVTRMVQFLKDHSWTVVLTDGNGHNDLHQSARSAACVPAARAAREPRPILDVLRHLPCPPLTWRDRTDLVGGAQ